MAELKLFTFGPPRLERDGRPVDIPLRRALALLLYLAVTNQPQGRDTLATLLWPESGQQEARGRLRRILYRLAEALGDDVVDAGRDLIALRHDARLWIDSAYFQQWIAEGLAANSSDERSARLAQAVELYSDDFLAGFDLPDSPAFDEWLFFERERLRHHLVQALERLVQIHTELGAWDAAISYARRCIRLDPLHERSHRALMQIYARSGQQSAALRQYQECVRLLEAELGVEPEHETTALFEAIQAKQLTSAVEHKPPAARVPDAPGAVLPRGVRHAPAPGTPLVGRKQECAEVAALLGRDDVRLVTLTGPGGVGKTRLALAVAEVIQATFAAEVIFVGLQALSDATLVLPTIAQALEIMEQGGQQLLKRVQTALQDRTVLLVLDNFEQVLDAGVDVAELLGVATLKVLATSRAALRLRAEHVIAVEPLATPRPPLPPLDEMSRYAAVRLFSERAQAARADFQITNANALAVAEICAQLDGLPLAIELAAARVRVLPPEALAQRLGRRLNVLTGGARDLPARQQTLRATIDWSYHLLEPDEQRLFEPLAVFAGGWTLAAAEALCTTDGALVDALDGLQSLIEKSLVHRDTRPGSEPRFTMLETTREYALERLAGNGDLDTVRSRHTEYYLALAEQAESMLETPQSAAWLDCLEADHDNLRAALQWTLERAEAESVLRLVGALWRFWQVRGHLSEGRLWVERMLDVCGRPAVASLAWARALSGAGTMAFAQAKFDEAERYQEQALALYRELEDRKGTAQALNNLAIQVVNLGDKARAYTLFQESLELHRELGDQVGVVYALCNLAVVVLEQGEYAHSQALSEEGLALSQATGQAFTTANMLSNLGLAVLLQGDAQRSTILFKRGLVAFRELGGIVGMAECLEGLALSFTQTEPARFARLFAAAERQRSNVGAPRASYLRAIYGQHVEAARSQMSDNAWTSTWADGQAMTLEQAIAFALDETGHG